ncbi:HMG domain-containing protein 4a [Erpetoichthys calabaricus]|uniref:HMG box domain containing 4a n=1 Tax=Erpetoichthys calabaricus TaxID=27687 RepID=A0A8C4SEW9_ERPCA|nr:HMG domain-containing protein 4a [Erpetoichthys calabaricus]XP_028671423.1 HMG domain-containing protein 4a [Erpetoichthys calabaricus]XP_051790647.1 HMG domain-containing protein 4a [Erpetoichthys calabaricus]
MQKGGAHRSHSSPMFKQYSHKIRPSAMAYEEIKKKGDSIVLESGIEEVGLVAGRSQREKKRSYKDLLREEEEIAAQVRKSSKKRKDSEFYLLPGESHKKKKKYYDEEYHYGELSPLHSLKKKKKVESSSSSSHTDTAMGLLKAITSPLATGSKPSSHSKKTAFSPYSHNSFSMYSGSGSGIKERRKSGDDLVHHKSLKKSSSKGTGLYVNTNLSEPLTLRDAEGLKMKLILSPKDEGGDSDNFTYPASHSTPMHTSSHSKKSSKKLSRDHGSGGTVVLSKTIRKKHPKEPLPIVGQEVEVEGRFEPEFYGDVSGFDLSGVSGGSLEGFGDTGSSSGGELEAGELIIDDSYREVQKKKKKSKKSKKKKDKEKEKHKSEKKHSKLGKKTSSGSNVQPVTSPGSTIAHSSNEATHGYSHSVSKSSHGASGTSGTGVFAGSASTSTSSTGAFVVNPPPIIHHHHHHHSTESSAEKKKKKDKEDREKDKSEKEKPKKKNMTAYQVFCKEYRININAEHPGLVFGELSKKLAEVWKHLPEKDKLVWKQKAQYLQHKQNKAEAMTVKRKSSVSDGGTPKNKVPSPRVTSPCRKSPTGSVSMSMSPARVPDVDPIDVAAHLQLLGESLSLIGHRLQETEGMVAVSGSLSVLLDSILCALGPLACLTAQVPELNGCPRPVLSNTLDNIAYIMPGL